MSALSLIVSALALYQGGPTTAAVPRLEASVHNFYGPLARPPSQDTDLCMLCHVPNRVERQRRGPLWEARLVGRHAALDVRADPAGPPLALRWAGSTLRCLSCHDATVSSIAIVHRASSGSLQGDATASSEAQRSGRNGPALFVPQDWTSSIMGNHPVSVPYPLESSGSEYKGFGPRAQPVDVTEWVADPRRLGLRLVNDSSGFDVLRGSAGVECVSCHDPHGTPNTYFLRLPKERSELCLACHRK